MPLQGDTPGTAAGCSELIANGGFEVDDLAWEPLTPGLPPAQDHEYVTSPVFSGDQALKLGITAGENTATTNGVFQTVYLPRTANPIVLGFHYLPKHENDPGNDLQTLDIVDPSTGERISRLWAQLANSDNWRFLQFDLTALRGRTVRVQFAVNNDGSGGKTALYLDNVSLLACDVAPAPTPTNASTGTPSVTPFVSLTPTSTGFPTVPSPTQTPTPFGTPALTPTSTPPSVVPSPTATFPPTPILSPTPPAAGCVVEGIGNGSFEEPIHESSGWILGKDPVPPQLAADDYAGLRALRLGNPPGASSKNVVTYSSARQLSTLPSNAITARLFWAHESFTQEVFDENVGNWNDRQELILLSPELVTLDILYRRLVNNAVWQEEVTDLTPYIGKAFYIYFNVFNDGDGLRTWMNLDAVRLELCYSVPLPTATAILFPDATFTPTPGFTVEAAPPIEATEVPADLITTTDRSMLAAETPEVDVNIDTLQVVVPESEDAQRAFGQDDQDGDAVPSLFQGFGDFLAGNWTWAIPWGLLIILLLWRFLR